MNLIWRSASSNWEFAFSPRIRYNRIFKSISHVYQFDGVTFDVRNWFVCAYNGCNASFIFPGCSVLNVQNVSISSEYFHILELLLWPGQYCFKMSRYQEVCIGIASFNLIVRTTYSIVVQMALVSDHDFDVHFMKSKTPVPQNKLIYANRRIIPQMHEALSVQLQTKAP